MPIIGSLAGASSRGLGGLIKFGSVVSAIGDFEAIATVQGTNSSRELVFNSIPSTYKHLMIRGVGNQNHGNNDYGNFGIRLNGHSNATYTAHMQRSYWDGSTGNAQTVNLNSYDYAFCGIARLATSNTEPGLGAAIFTILDYTTNKTKTVRCISGFGFPPSNRGILQHGVSTSTDFTSVVNSITVYSSNSNWTSKTKFSLYGIKG